jgi:APA family basic amino acid/polyamine antiporter
MAELERGRLLRVLGLAFGVAAVVGGVVGQGILRSPGVVAQGVPAAELILILWALGAAFTAIDAMAIAELGASIPRAGGPYAFAHRAFGPAGGFLVGWLDAGMLIISSGYLAVVVAEYLQRLGAVANLPLGVVAAFVMLVFGVLNAFGTRAGGGVQNAASAIKALALLFFAALIFLLPGEARAAPPETPAMTAAGVALAAIAVQQTYYGASTAVYFSEEVNEPGKNLPRATFAGVGVVALVYLAIVAALLYALPVAAIAKSNLPVADALQAAVGEAGDRAVTLFALFSVAAVGNIGVMQQTRTLFAMAREGFLPGPLAAVARNGTPQAALWTAVLLGAGLAATGVYERLLTIGAPILAVVNMLLGVSVIRMRMKEPDLARPYRMPLYPLPAVVSILVNAGLAVFFIASDSVNTRWSILFVVAAAPVYYSMTRNRRLSGGP